MSEIDESWDSIREFVRDTTGHFTEERMAAENVPPERRAFARAVKAYADAGCTMEAYALICLSVGFASLGVVQTAVLLHVTLGSAIESKALERN